MCLDQLLTVLAQPDELLDTLIPRVQKVNRLGRLQLCRNVSSDLLARGVECIHPLDRSASRRAGSSGLGGPGSRIFPKVGARRHRLFQSLCHRLARRAVDLLGAVLDEPNVSELALQAASSAGDAEHQRCQADHCLNVVLH